jgi:nucleoside-diphosphate-sugar epimerase
MYERTKWEAEQALNRMALASSEVRLYVVRPTNVIDDFRSGLVGDMQKLTTLGRLKFMIKGGESAHLIHAADVASAAIYLTLSEEEKSGTYFIGCDEHIGNTVSGVLTRCKNMEAKSSLLDNFFLPAELIYWVRGLLKGPSLHGRSKFSSRKLLETGFSYPIGFEGIFERIRGVSEQKNNKQ